MSLFLKVFDTGGEMTPLTLIVREAFCFGLFAVYRKIIICKHNLFILHGYFNYLNILCCSFFIKSTCKTKEHVKVTRRADFL